MVRKIRLFSSAVIAQWPLMVFMLIPISILFIIGELLFFRYNPDPNFWFIPRPPTPPDAVNVQYSDGGSLGGSRLTQFETRQPAEAVGQYYQSELPKRGWQFSCSPGQPENSDCPLTGSPEEEQSFVFRRHDNVSLFQAVEIIVYKPGVNLPGSSRRLVEIYEYRYPMPKPMDVPVYPAPYP